MRLFWVGLICGAVCPAQQQQISVRNAASLLAPIAPGSIIEIQSLNIPRIINPDPHFVSVEVRPAGSSASIAATLIGAPLLRIWALLPANTPSGPALVTLTVSGESSSPAPIVVAQTSFGLFTEAQNGLGPALAQNQIMGQPPTRNQLTNPVLPEQYVILWGTGLGEARTGDVIVQLGGRDVAPEYAGPAPGIPGVDQINFRVPPDLGAPDGCYVSVIVRVGDTLSNESSISKASRPGACEHPFGLSESEMSTLDSGSAIVLGAVGFESDRADFQRSMREFVRADFRHRSPFDVSLLALPLRPDDAYFGCRLGPFPGLTGLIVTPVDAGEFLTLTGAGKTILLSRPLYSTTLDPPALTSGLWRIAGSGGTAIGPFEAEHILPPLPRLAGEESITSIDRRQNYTIAWNPTGYSENDVATVSLGLNLVVLQPVPIPSSGPRQVVCRAPAKAGQLIIPSTLMQALDVPFVTLRLSISPHPNRRKFFDVPLTSGQTAKAVFDYFLRQSIPIQLR